MPKTKNPKNLDPSKFAIDPKTGIMQYIGKVPSKQEILNSIKGDTSREAQIIRLMYGIDSIVED